MVVQHTFVNERSVRKMQYHTILLYYYARTGEIINESVTLKGVL